MNQNEVRGICGAAMLRFDAAVLESLAIIGDMMEEVVRSELCVSEERTAPEGESTLRSDDAGQAFTREEMLSGAKCRKGEFVIVPVVIQSEKEKHL